jgi:hypothetical protein
MNARKYPSGFATLDQNTVIGALSHAVGEEKARAAVEAAIEDMALDRGHLSREDVLRVLERIAQAKGVVGVCARFARSRLILQWASDDYSR